MAGENFAARARQAGSPQSQLKASTFTGGARSAAPAPTKVIAGGNKFTQKAKAIGAQTASTAGQGTLAAGRFVVNRVVKDAGAKAMDAFYALNPSIARARQAAVTQEIKQLDQLQAQINDSYKSGKMGREDYRKAQLDLSTAYQEMSKLSVENAAKADPKRLNIGLAETAINIASVGTFTLTKAVVKEGAKEGAKKVLPKLFDDAAKSVEKSVQKVPAMGALIERNLAAQAARQAQKLAGETTGQYLAREGKQVAIGLLVKQPLFYQQNIDSATKIYDDILSGSYQGALTESAWVSTQLLRGGPLGAFVSGARWVGKAGGKLAYGKESYIDYLGRLTNGDAQSYARYLGSLDKNSKEYKDAEKALRIAQEIGIQVTGDAKRAAQATVDAWAASGLDITQLSPEQGVKAMLDFADAMDYFTRNARTGKIRGIDPKDYQKYVLVRWDVNAKNDLAKQFEEAGDDINELADILRRWETLPGSAANNKTLSRTLNRIVSEEINNISDVPLQRRIANRIRDISAVSVMPKGIDSATKKYLAKRGYAIAAPYNPTGKTKLTPKVTLEDTRRLVTAAVKNDTEVFDAAVNPVPFVASIARAVQRLGISPESTTKLAQTQLSRNVVAYLQRTNIAKSIGLAGEDLDNGGKAILSKLQRYLDEKQPNKILNLAVLGKAPGPAITDIRQLSNAEIREALGVSFGDARRIQRAIIKGYMDTPLEYRGLGDKIVDTLYSVNPLQRHYSRIQSALRYTYNPFFRFQEKVETSLLARAQARTILWGKSKQELDDIARTLDNSGVFSTGLSGEAAQDLTLGRITATLTQGQKRNIAGLADRIARTRGVSVEELIRDYGDEVGDALRVVVQYPNKGVLNSSLARTMNTAFFPMRYNTKVTMLAAEILSKEPPSVQLAVLKSVFDLKDWLNSDEGIQWRAQHADALAVFEWATPVGSINYFMKLVGGDARLADFGSLGGLPLGVISQTLDSQGIIRLNNPYVDPKTGDVLPKYIPETARARASVALTDLLGSMFTYPGRILGLPGKGQTLNRLSQELTGADGLDFSRVEQDERLTDLQRNYIRVLKGDHSDEALDALYYAPTPEGYQGYTIPPLTLPGLTERQPLVERRQKLPTKAELKAARRTARTSRAASGKKPKPLPQPITR